MTTLILVTDAFRWWGALAGYIGLFDICRWVRAHWVSEPVPLMYLPRYSALAKCALCLFLVLAGTSIPLAARSYGIESLLQFRLIAVSWALVSLAGWLFIVSHAQRRPMMFATALVAFPAMLLAAIATAPGGG